MVDLREDDERMCRRGLSEDEEPLQADGRLWNWIPIGWCQTVGRQLVAHPVHPSLSVHANALQGDEMLLRDTNQRLSLQESEWAGL